MVFRPVEVPSGGWLDDKQIELGRTDENLAYKEGRLLTHIAGAFTDPENSSRRSYYMAKYETSQLQYEAFGESCPRPRKRKRLPVVSVSWFDAVAFAREYSEWLLANARERLPREGETPGYVRLPTEVEWEYAARGGMKVDEAQFIASLFPMPEGEVAEYAWFQGSQSAAGELQLTGLLKPNPLGLHDMVGNAGEMIFEAFRLNRRGRLHGQAGSFVSKGGDIATSRDQLRTATRHEHAYFDARGGKATTLRRLGFRLILSVPVIVSGERLTQIRDEWALLAAPDLTGQTGRQELKAMTALSAASRETADEELRAKLQTALADLEQAITERNDSRDRAVRALVRMGAFLGNKIRTDQVRVRSVERAIDDVSIPALDRLRKLVEGRDDGPQLIATAEKKLELMRKGLAGIEENARLTLSYYGDTVITVARDHSVAVVTPQLEVVKVEFEGKRNSYLIPYAELFVKHLTEYHDSRTADTARWLREIIE